MAYPYCKLSNFLSIFNKLINSFNAQHHIQIIQIFFGQREISGFLEIIIFRLV